MQFGLYLKKKGAITADELIAAIEVQQSRMPRIGQLAMEEGILSAREVFEVLRYQRNLPNEPFGEAAVSMGLMSRADLFRLLAMQWERRMTLADALVERRILIQTRVDEELAAYRCEMQRRDAIVTRSISQSPYQSVAGAVPQFSFAEQSTALV